MSENNKSFENKIKKRYMKTPEYLYEKLDDDLELIWDKVLKPYINASSEGGILYNLDENDFSKFRKFFSDVSEYENELYDKINS